MSRSKAKNTRWLKNYKGAKRTSNKKIRKYVANIDNNLIGKGFRKVMNTYDVNDGFSTSKPIEAMKGFVKDSKWAIKLKRK